jgi:esterase/lipase superfamily enzyme
MFALLLGFTAPAASEGAFDPMLGAEVETAIAGGDADRALDLLRQALADNDDPWVEEDLLDLLATTLERLGRHQDAAVARLGEAEAIGDRLGRLAPERLTPLDVAAAAFERGGQVEDAVAAIEEILAILLAGGREADAEPWLRRLEALAAGADDETAASIGDIVTRFRSDAEQARSAPLGGDEGYSVVRIYYGTDRARTGSAFPSKFYGGDRGTLEMGTALVSVPASHRPGQLEKPNIWTFDVRLDPERHIVLQAVEPAPADDVFARMRKHVEETGTREAFVFVHGFNVTFADAARRTAQMAYDMNFSGLPILYSWPSRGSVLSYISDTAVVNLSGRRLTLFLEEVVARSGAERIHLVAHSMGNRALTDALELYALRNRDRPPSFDQVLFTAPDLDAGLFAEMARTIRPTATRLTLYTSDKDWALAVSRRLHGDAARAGQGGDGILLSPVFDTVDMTMIGEDILAHSYFANNASALTDIFSLFWRDAPPDQRCGMEERAGPNGIVYWYYAPEECDSAALLSTLAILKRSSVGNVAEARAFFNRYIGSVSIDPLERSRLLEALGKLFGG